MRHPATGRHRRRPKGAFHWAKRQITRYKPGLILAVFVLIVGVPLVAGFASSTVGDWLDGEKKAHDVSVSLLEHVAVAALVAAVAYYWLFGFKRQWALRRYRKHARNDPEPSEFVDWALAYPPKLRPAVARLLADGIAHSPDPVVVVVQGRAGTGRTSFIAWLVPALAKKKLIPVPVLARGSDLFDLDSVQKAFCRNSDEVLNTDEELDAIWYRAKATRDMVVLVDGLDDEIVDRLWRDGGDQLARAIRSLHSKNISVVLATTGELPLGDITALREDLDHFSREEAKTFLAEEIRRTSGNDPGATVEARINEAGEAVEQLPDLVGESSIAPFYLDVLLRLQAAGIPLTHLPPHTDQWRDAVLGRYLEAVGSGRIDLDRSSGATGGHEPDAGQRGRDAVEAAEAVARKLKIERADLMVARSDLEKEIKNPALADARRLNLLWFGAERVGFAADDLGAYLVAKTQADSDRLLEDLRKIVSKTPSKRRDRHVFVSLIFWHLLHGEPARGETFKKFLRELENSKTLRPPAVAAAIRIVATCGLAECGGRVERLAQRCIEESFADDAEPSYDDDRLGIVRALAGWDVPAAQRLLWQLARSKNVEVAWPAAKALAVAKRPEPALEREIEGVLAKAEARGDLAAMSSPDDELGNSLRALAWTLPALRDQGDVEGQLERVTKLCLGKGMSPLRGEMSLAQGLKLAAVNGKASEKNCAHAGELLASKKLVFWHARLVLVHAMLAGAWNGRDGAGDELRGRLRTFRSSEPHPFVRQGIALARDGLRDLRWTTGAKKPPLTRYMWTHERDAVRWVEPGRHGVTQLAGDVVLLSNMIYRLRIEEATKPPDQVTAGANSVAASCDLPECLRDSEARERIVKGCDCGLGLCDSNGRSPVLETRAPFSESFCREQARVVARHGLPRWTKRPIGRRRRCRRQLKEFWEEQARAAQPKSE